MPAFNVLTVWPPRIHYSDRYADDEYEYRHVILPKSLLRLIPQEFFVNNDKVNTLRLLSEPEWRGIGITQSLGWEHYEVHSLFFFLAFFRTSYLLSLSLVSAGATRVAFQAIQGLRASPTAYHEASRSQEMKRFSQVSIHLFQ